MIDSETQETEAPNDSPELAQGVAETLARIMTERGLPLTAEEAQVMANLGSYVAPLLAEEPYTSTKVTRVLTTNSPLSMACLATLAKVVVQQHTLDYDGDVNLRGLSLLQCVLAITGALTQPKPLKHPGG